MPRPSLVLAIGALALLAGCATMSVEERTAACAGTDWYRFGANDGALGVPTEERSDKLADCAELGHPADMAAYQAGRSEGLREYCTLESGYRVGYSGRRYENVCPPTLEPDFLQGYAKGRDDRPAFALYPGVGIGIGSGGVRTRVGVGLGVGLWNGYGRYPYSHYDGLFYRRPFGCGVFWPGNCW